MFFNHLLTHIYWCVDGHYIWLLSGKVTVKSRQSFGFRHHLVHRFCQSLPSFSANNVGCFFYTTREIDYVQQFACCLFCNRDKRVHLENFLCHVILFRFQMLCFTVEMVWKPHLKPFVISHLYCKLPFNRDGLLLYDYSVACQVLVFNLSCFWSSPMTNFCSWSVWNVQLKSI